MIKNYFENLNINHVTSAYTHVKESWAEQDFTIDFNKIYYITEGECYLKILGKEYIAKPGYMYLFPAAHSQSFHNLEGQRVKKYWCHFDATIGGRNVFELIKCPLCVKVKSHNDAKLIFEKMLNQDLKNSISSAFYLKAAVTDLIAFYLEQCGEDVYFDSNTDDNIAKITKYIDDNIDKSITINELAETVHMHPNYFIRYFRTRFGYSPMRFINKLKIENAKHLLVSSEIPVNSVASMVGVSDIFYFSKLFKKFTGYTPSEYRNYTNN